MVSVHHCARKVEAQEHRPDVSMSLNKRSKEWIIRSSKLVKLPATSGVLLQPFGTSPCRVAQVKSAELALF